MAPFHSPPPSCVLIHLFLGVFNLLFTSVIFFYCFFSNVLKIGAYRSAALYF